MSVHQMHTYTFSLPEEQYREELQEALDQSPIS